MYMAFQAERRNLAKRISNVFLEWCPGLLGRKTNEPELEGSSTATCAKKCEKVHPLLCGHPWHREQAWQSGCVQE